VQVTLSPASIALPTGATATIRATVTNASNTALSWSIAEGSEGGTITSAGAYTAPSTPGTFHVIARSQADTTKTATSTVTVTAPTVTAFGTPLFGTLHTPNNRPISDWEPDIRRYYGLADTSTIVDAAATRDLQDAFATSRYNTPYAVFGQVSYAIYYAKAGDPEYPIADISGRVRTCPLDPAGRGVRIPAGAKRWSTPVAGTVPVIPATPGDTDIHFTVIDVERNRVYAFYSYGGDTVGVTNGQFRSSTRACDLLKGSDATVLAAQSYTKRYGCTGGAGYPGAGCGTEGIGAGVSAGAGFGNGDSNGFIGPHGVIMPQDFDDTGWSGAAVGTLHHALRCSAPAAFQHGYMWPMQDPMGGTRGLRDGQIFRLDPAYDVEASGASAAEKRIMRTLQRYGCVLSDYGDYGMALFALSAWDGVGPNRGANPWTAAGGAPPEAQSFYTKVSSQGVRFNLRIPVERMQVIRPHGAAYPPR
jgi:hypothetical protein